MNKLPTPKQIYKQLNKFIINQEEAKKKIAVSIYLHYKKTLYFHKDIVLEKSNILLIGPTGCGKTLLAESISNLLNVPYIIVDATTLTEAGYVGEDVENILYKLLDKYNFDLNEIEKGIIYIDEIDKIATCNTINQSITRDISGQGVQQALLKLIEGTIAAVPLKGGRNYPEKECILVDTSNILFICGGTFNGINQIIKSRFNKITLGFNAIYYDNKKEYKIETNDLIQYGLIPELVGRLPIIITMNNLKEKELIKILYKPKNALIKQYKYLFKKHNKELFFTLKAMKFIVKKTILLNIGVRGLRNILEGILLNIMYKLPNLKNVFKIIINENVINNNFEPILIYKKIYINNKKGFLKK